MHLRMKASAEIPFHAWFVRKISRVGRHVPGNAQWKCLSQDARKAQKVRKAQLIASFPAQRLIVQPLECRSEEMAIRSSNGASLPRRSVIRM